MQGAGGVPLTSCHVSSAAYTGDIHLALQFLSGLFPGAPLLACGYSMGGASHKLIAQEGQASECMSDVRWHSGRLRAA